MYLNKETLHQYTMFMSIFRENINLDSRYIHHFYLNTLHKPPRYLSSIHNLQIPLNYPLGEVFSGKSLKSAAK